MYRYAQRHLRAAFPALPVREQDNRQVRRQHTALVAFLLSDDASYINGQIVGVNGGMSFRG